MLKIKLSDLVIDPSIQVRSVCSYTLANYRASFRSGSVFPPIVVEEKTNRVVCGNHRYFMYKTEVSPETLIDCDTINFKSEVDIIKYAASDNARHGKPLATFDKKRIILRLRELGVDLSEISQTLSLPVRRVEVLAGMTVCVIGKKAKKPYRRVEPVKHGLEHMQGKSVSEDQYQDHAQMDRGVPASSMAASLIRWIENGWIPNDSKTMGLMAELQSVLNEFLKVRAVG